MWRVYSFDFRCFLMITKMCRLMPSGILQANAIMVEELPMILIGEYDRLPDLSIIYLASCNGHQKLLGYSQKLF